MMGFDGLWEILEESLLIQLLRKSDTTSRERVLSFQKNCIHTFLRSIIGNLKQAHNGENEKKILYDLYTNPRQYVSTLTEHGLDVRQFYQTLMFSKEPYLFCNS